MADDLWENGAAVVSRLESRLRAAIGRDVFQSSAVDLNDSLAPVIGVAVSCSAPDGLEQLAVAGDQATGESNLKVRGIVSPETELAIEIWFAEQDRLSSTTRQAVEETADAVCGLLISALARIRLYESETEFESISESISILFDDTDPAQRLHRIAVELAGTLQVDRLSVLRKVGRRFEFVASSVQPQFDRRAERVLQTQLVAAVLQSRVALQQTLLVVSRGATDDAVDTFLESGSGQSVVATNFVGEQILVIGECLNSLPEKNHLLGKPQRSLFDAALADSLRSQPQRLTDRVRSSLANWSNRRRLATAAALLIFLTFFPMTIQVTADGHVLPRSQHIVYAPVTGQIERVECETGTQVVAGQVLCEFSSHDLELSLTRVSGEILTVQEQLQIAATRRGDGSVKDVSSDRRVLEVRRRELQKQYDVLSERQSELVVRSPIAGVVSLVLQDDLGSLATGRPVELGQPIIRVINPDAGYHVELDVPAEEIGYVISALGRQESKPVLCHYRFRSEPETQRDGILTRLQQTASANRIGQLVVVASVEPSDKEVQFAADSGVIGWIRCDRAPAGFVLCRKVIERLRLWGWL